MDDLKLMPDVLDLREIMFTNILMLGFDVEAKESEHRIAFNRDMFSTPNVKAMEVILHFLFSRLHHDSAKEGFRGCWPVIEKRQAQDFRKVCIDWLTKIKKDPDCFIPNISPALLLSPSGNRFYQFLFYFTIHILKQRMISIPRRYGAIPSRPIILPATKSYTHQFVRGLDLSFINQKKRLIDFVEGTEHVKNTWIDYASDLSKEHRKLNKKKREWEKKMKEVKERIQLVLGKSTISAKDVLKRTHDMQKVKETWQTISKFYETQKKLKEQVEYIITNQHDTYSLDGANINFKLPDLLVRECERQLHMGNKYDNIYEEGKVDLTSLVNLWNLSLHLTKEALTQCPLPNVTQDEAYIRAEAHKHGSNLNNTISLKHMLTNQISDLNLSIEVLKERLQEQSDVSHSPVKDPEKFCFDILPCTPSLVFEPTKDFQQSEIAKREFSFESPVVATPDAVQFLLDKLDNTVLKEAATPLNSTISMLVSESSKQISVAEEGKNACTKPIVSSKIPTWKLKHKQKKNIKPLTNQNGDMATAQRILIEQITESVVSNNPTNISDNTGNKILDLHAFEKPFEAFNADIFVKQDKVLRTPQMKSGISEPMFTPITQASVAPLSQDFFTPIHNFDIKENNSKQENQNIYEHSIFTPFQDMRDRASIEQLMIFTPIHVFKTDQDSPHEDSHVGKAFTIKKDIEYSPLLCHDDSTLKEEDSNVMSDITNNVDKFLFTRTREINKSPQTSIMENKTTITSIQNLCDEEKNNILENKFETLMKTCSSLLTPATQDTKVPLLTLIPDNKNIRNDSLVTSAAGKSDKDFENVQSAENKIISPSNLSLEVVDEFIEDVMLNTTAGINEAAFTSIAQMSIAPIPQELFTPIHNFEIETSTFKQSENKYEHPNFTPVRNMQGITCKDELSIFTPICDFQLSNDPPEVKAFKIEKDTEHTLSLCHDESTLKEDISPILERSKSPNPGSMENKQATTPLQNFNYGEKTGTRISQQNITASLMKTFSSLETPVNQDAEVPLITHLSDDKDSLQDNIFMTPAAKQNNIDFAKVPCDENKTISPINLSIEEVNGFLEDVMLNTSTTPALSAKQADIPSSWFCNTPTFSNDFNLLTPDRKEKNLRHGIRTDVNGDDDDDEL